MLFILVAGEHGEKKAMGERRETLDESSDDPTPSYPLPSEIDLSDKVFGQLQSQPITSCGNEAYVF